MPLSAMQNLYANSIGGRRWSPDPQSRGFRGRSGRLLGRAGLPGRAWDFSLLEKLAPQVRPERELSSEKVKPNGSYRNIDLNPPRLSFLVGTGPSANGSNSTVQWTKGSSLESLIMAAIESRSVVPQ